MSDSVLIEELTWPEVEQALADGKRTAILACAAVEQHGPHLPTGTDAYLGTAIAEQAARLAGNALVAPTLRPGLSEHHMHFPGSLTVAIETFVALLGDYLASLARQGFERVVLFASHGGNVDAMKAFVPSLAKRLAPQGCELVLSQAYPDFAGTMLLLAEDGISPGRAGVHAGYAETSMMLACEPALVNEARIEPGRSDDDFYAAETVLRSQLESFVTGVQTQSPNGILGDPTGSAAAVGVRLIRRAAEALARECREAQPAGTQR